MSDWIQTYTGRKFYPMNPDPKDVCIEDIAHALSLLCRFGGHCIKFYSVAEHSILLSRHVAPEHTLQALLHDAAEAYICDLPRPTKAWLLGYREAEDVVQRAICKRFGVAFDLPDAVVAADRSILMDERLQNMTRAPEPWSTDGEPLDIKLEYWNPQKAEEMFLIRFKLLT